MQGVRLVLPYLKRHKLKIFLCFIGFIFANIAMLLSPYVLGKGVDAVAQHRPMGTLLLYALLLLVVTAVAGVFRFAARYLGSGNARDIEYELRNDLFGHLQRQDAAFFQNSRTGDLMARATNDLNAVQRSLGMGITNLINTIIGFTMTVAAMLTIDVKLALYSAVLLPVMSVIMALSGQVIRRRFELVQARFADMSTMVQENASGVRVVKAYAQEGAELDEFKGTNSDYVDASISQLKIQSIIGPSMYAVGGLATIMVLYIGGMDVIRGDIRLGQLVQFLGYIVALRWPMISLGFVINTVQQGTASMVRLQRVLDHQPAVQEPESPRVPEETHGEIEFRGVTMRYGQATVLSDINLRIPAGSSLGIIGTIGAGKSTLVSLIARQWDPTEGQVLIDGIDVRLYPLEELRRVIGFVPQDTFLFSEPMRDNIAYGVEHAAQDRIEWAASVSQLEKDVDQFPQGYDTWLGERGVTLSGGQKQRTAIARAVMKDPKILILDDALSSVDTYTEDEILRRLREVMATRTSIMIAHRISTVQRADNIIVLDEGRIVEQGDHEELVRFDGLYASMYRRQLLAEELNVEITEGDEITIGSDGEDATGNGSRT